MPKGTKNNRHGDKNRKENNMAKDLEQLNSILFDQLEALSKLDVKSESFEKEKEKATIVCETADRIIKNSELGLRNQVWQATRKFKLLTNNEPVKALSIRRGVEYDIDD